MKVKLPKDIKIACYTYQVQLDESQDDSEFAATVVHKRETVRISPLLSPRTRDVSYLHELVHVIGKVYGITPPEGDVDLLALGMGEFLFNNLDIQFDWSNVPEVERRLKEDKNESEKG